MQRGHRGQKAQGQVCVPEALAPHLAAGGGIFRTNGQWETCIYSLCAPASSAGLLEAPRLDPLPAHRCVSLISFILSLTHPFPGRVSASLSLTHTHSAQGLVSILLTLLVKHSPAHISLGLHDSFFLHPLIPFSQCWQEQGLCPCCCSKVLGLLIIEPIKQHGFFKGGHL